MKAKINKDGVSDESSWQRFLHIRHLETQKKTEACFSNWSSANFSGPESCLVFVVFTFKIKGSVILEIIQWH